MSDIKKGSEYDDGFWDLGEPTVKKNPSATHSQVRKPVAADITVSSQNSTSDLSDIPLSIPPKRSSETPQKEQSQNIFTQYVPPHRPKKTEKKPVFEYSPGNILIKKVRIFSSAKDGKLFDRTNLFIRERNAFLSREGKKCAKADFFSFSPRYSQMTRPQLEWYLWWRENMRHGEYIDTDEAYVRLYLQELLATDEGEDILGALDKMCSLFNLTVKNKSFIAPISRMIFDFCLLHRLDAPVEKLLENYSRILFFEEENDFFLGMSRENRRYFADVVLNNISVYNYKKSKFASGERAELFDTHMRSAMTEILCDDKAFDEIASCASGVFNSTLTEHRLFRSSSNLSTPAIRAEISAYPVSCIKGILTDAVRYTENCLREYLGIKSKLTVLSVNTEIKNVADRYFALHLPRSQENKKAKKISVQTNEYDKFYDLPPTEISSASAAMIEEESWSTTKLLTEAFTESTESAEPSKTSNESEKILMPAASEAVEVCENQSGENGIYAMIREKLGEKSDFIKLSLEGNSSEQKSFARGFGMTQDELADIINEIAATLTGDILLEEVGEVYRIIDDYKDKI